MPNIIIRGLAICFVWVIGELVGAGKVFANDLDQQVRAADLVFDGVVVDVQTRFSERASESTPLVPYRFVTYRINRVLKGNYQHPLVTLRFLGGATENGQVLLIPGQPLFDAGDHDLLLVRGNNWYPCPLVGCERGRYRFIGGMVVNELGQRIYLDSNGQIKLGETIDSNDITTNQLSENISIGTREVVETDGSEVAEVLPDFSNATTVDPAGFTSTLDETIQQNHAQQELDSLPPFQSADPDAPFVDPTYESAGPSVGQAPPSDPAISDDIPEDERVERQMDAARMARVEEEELSPEQRRELAARNKQMASTHPVFHAGEADPMPSGDAQRDEGPEQRQVKEVNETVRGVPQFVWYIVALAGIVVLILLRIRGRD